jgi:hypothetical protein
MAANAARTTRSNLMTSVMENTLSMERARQEVHQLEILYAEISDKLETRNDVFLTCDDLALVQFREMYFTELLTRISAILEEI